MSSKHIRRDTWYVEKQPSSLQDVKEFETFMNCRFISTPALLIKLARCYHEVCDEFDENYLTGKLGPDGGKMPANSEEQRAMARHSSLVLEDMWLKAQAAGHGRKEFQEAIHTAARIKR